ncbi:MAG TPA: hypothetical protein DER09_03300 [Prolixibacteraceae bacterium]|nr:hypothetical protein [Prolixibacteraceae bacterium]
MNINNRKSSVILKRTFFIVSVIMAILALLFFLLNMVASALITLGVFSVWFLFFQFADYQYIDFSSEKSRIRLRYYKAISFGGTSFNEIEFPFSALKKAVFENSFFGKNTDVTFFIRTNKGVAEYPSVSLSALKKEDRYKMANVLNSIQSTR